MSSLAEVLDWKFDSAPGIRTREDGQGGAEGPCEGEVKAMNLIE